MENDIESSKYYIGHRERMRERFLRCGGEGMTDADILEMLLMSAIPRRDVKPVARDLLAKFGSLGSVIHASYDSLKEIKGIGDAVIVSFMIVKEAALRLLHANLSEKPVINNMQKLVDYCIAKMGRDKVESLRVMFFDTKFSLLADELLSSGTIDKVAFSQREILRRVVALNASSFVLVHNHPSGDTEPSGEDVCMTKEVMKAASLLGIEMLDHIIVSESGYTSFKLRGLI